MKDNTCDHTSGKCTCKNNIDGQICDACSFGWYGFANCQGEID